MCPYHIHVRSLNSLHIIPGYSSSQETVHNGELSSSAKAFLRPVMGRENLHVSMNSYVTKVISINVIFCTQYTRTSINLRSMLLRLRNRDSVVE